MFKNKILAKVYKLETISTIDAFEEFKTKSFQSLFLDVRTPWELQRDPKIKKSTAIPLSDLSAKMGDIKKQEGLEKKIIVVCRSGNRAVSAGIKLKKAGFSNVQILQGGITGWQRANYPLIRPKKRNTGIG